MKEKPNVSNYQASYFSARRHHAEVNYKLRDRIINDTNITKQNFSMTLTEVAKKPFFCCKHR